MMKGKKTTSHHPIHVTKMTRRKKRRKRNRELGIVEPRRRQRCARFVADSTD
jgi:hypothetical protein